MEAVEVSMVLGKVSREVLEVSMALVEELSTDFLKVSVAVVEASTEVVEVSMELQE